MNHRENEQLRQCKREEARLRKCQIHKQKIHKSPHRTHFWNNLVGDQNTIEKHCSQNHQHESRNHHGKRRSIQQAGKPIINRCKGLVLNFVIKYAEAGTNTPLTSM